jgi:hypothetical protein
MCNYVGVEHHEGEPAVALQRVPVVIIDDRLLFPVEKLPVVGYLAVVLIDHAKPLLPIVELAGADADPGNELLGRDFSPFRPVADIVDNLVTGVVGNPDPSQSSPSSFLT